MAVAQLDIPETALSEICRRRQIHRLALFGSALRGDFGADSDIDLLTEFAPDAQVSFFSLLETERELSDLMGRRVDLNTAGCLHPGFREQVLREAVMIYGPTR